MTQPIVYPLRTWRVLKTRTIAGLSRETGVSTRTIREIEAGKRLPAVRTIAKLCQALYVRPYAVAEFRRAAGLRPGVSEEFERIGEDSVGVPR